MFRDLPHWSSGVALFLFVKPSAGIDFTNHDITTSADRPVANTHDDVIIQGLTGRPL
jgi:hypothetical protein